jgi:esterase
MTDEATQPAVTGHEVPEYLLELARRQGIAVGSTAAPAAVDQSVHGQQLRYYDWGGPPARPVLFVHGGGLTSKTWDLLALALRDRFHCVALDLRGHGESAWAGEGRYRLDDYARDVAGIAAGFNAEDCVLVGMSLGGQACLLAAAAMPGLRGLVLVDVGPESGSAGAGKILDFVTADPQFPTLEDAVQQALSFNPRRKPEILRQSLLNNLRRTAAGTWTWKYDARAFAPMRSQEVRAHRAAQLWDAVGQVQAPVLIVRGADSDVFSAEAARQLSSRFGHARLAVIPNSGHTIQGDNPAGLLREIEPFLNTCWPDPRAQTGRNQT